MLFEEQWSTAPWWWWPPWDSSTSALALSTQSRQTMNILRGRFPDHIFWSILGTIFSWRSNQEGMYCFSIWRKWGILFIQIETSKISREHYHTILCFSFWDNSCWNISHVSFCTTPGPKVSLLQPIISGNVYKQTKLHICFDFEWLCCHLPPLCSYHQHHLHHCFHPIEFAHGWLP